MLRRNGRRRSERRTDLVNGAPIHRKVPRGERTSIDEVRPRSTGKPAQYPVQERVSRAHLQQHEIGPQWPGSLEMSPEHAGCVAGIQHLSMLEDIDSTPEGIAQRNPR